jgi:O-acetyl-ADP-ribose deacetylase (regulator of RNase III)
MTENRIIYTKGDATAPDFTGKKIIVHICNDIGGWGKGFVMAISKKWKEPEKQYRDWHTSMDGFKLGAVQFVQVETDLWIANLIGQHKLGKGENGVPPIRYEAVDEGLAKVAAEAIKLNASVHMPRIGCGLAGGKWEEIEPLIVNNLIEQGVETSVYDFE